MVVSVSRLLQLPQVTQVDLLGAKQYQIDVEIPESTLRSHGLSRQRAADIIRRDETDSSRRHSPMRPADDAILIDTTERPPEKVLAEILALPHFSIINN